MHRYRAAAKRAAWYDAEDEVMPNYNPFRKIRASHRPSVTDEEHATRVTSHQSEANVMSTIEAVRMKQTMQHHNALPHHANTMPSSTNSTTPHPDQHSANVSSQAPFVDLPHSGKIVEEGQGNSFNGPKSDARETADQEIKAEKIESTDDSAHKKGLRNRFFSKHRTNKDVGVILDSDTSSKDDPTLAYNKKQFTFMNQLRATLFNSWINILLVFVPVGIAVKFAGVSKVAVFVINFIAIIPLAGMLSYATEEIALHVGETLGGLLNATFGNAVELIVSIIALAKDEVDIVQQSLIGSMLSNLLLVLGMCFFFGGLNRVKQHFNMTVAQTASSLLALAIGSLIIPAAFQRWSDGSQELKEPLVTKLSRGVAILLLCVYGAYLLFQLKTHLEIYNAPSPKVQKRSKATKVEPGATNALVADMGAEASATAGGRVTQSKPTRSPDEPSAGDSDEVASGVEEKEQPQLLPWVALLTLAISTAFVGICAEFMVDSIDAITANGTVSRTFVGLILLPIVGNAAEHATAVTVAIKDKMDLAIGVAVGSSMQIALLLIPFIVVLGWCMGKDDMNLAFDGFQITVLFVTILLVNYLIQDGESHWLEGVLLMTLYTIIALAAWFYPPDDPATNNARRWLENGGMRLRT